MISLIVFFNSKDEIELTYRSFPRVEVTGA